MDFTLCEHSTLRRCSLSLFLSLCLSFPSLAMSAGEPLTLTLTNRDELPQAVKSLKQLDTRAGDMLSLSSQYGEDFEFRVETSRRTNHGNKVIRGVSEAGGRLTMVVTSNGQLSGIASRTWQNLSAGARRGSIVWHFADPYLARPADTGGVKLGRLDRTAPAGEMTRHLKRRQRTVKKSSDETVHYPGFSSGTATLDLLFYYEIGMETPEAIADLVTEVTNQAMADSQIALRANVVAVKPLEIDPSTLQEDVLYKIFT